LNPFKEALIGSLRKQQGLKTTGTATRTIPAKDTPLYRLDHVSIIYLPDGSPHPHVVIGSFCNDQPYILDSDMPNGTGFYPSAWNGAKLEDAVNFTARWIHIKSFRYERLLHTICGFHTEKHPKV